VKFTVPINFQLAEEGEDTSTDKETTVVGFKPVSQKIKDENILQAVTFEAQNDLKTEDGPGAKVTIRGNSGPFTAETQPLYILDGEELDPLMFKTIDPNTISSINVLKGESATKIYGSKGANGVILINSKNK